MTDPQNVLAFLDVAGHWSPNLAGVMVGAIAVHTAWLRWGARHRLAGSSSSRARSHVDAALLGGSALFGIGWGLAGYCPGPSLVALGTGRVAPLVFVIAMLVGMLAERTFRGASAARALDATSLGSSHRS